MCALYPVAAQAAPNDTGEASADARVILIQPLRLVKSQDLEFGRIAPGPALGTVTVNPQTGACTKTGPILHIDGCQPAEFVGMGQRNAYVNIQLQNITNLTGPGAPMQLTNMQVYTAPDLAGTIFQVLGWPVYRINTTSGIFDFKVGGTLRVNANQAPGVYNGTFNVRIDYY